jgi:hypothetical protein
MKRPPSVGVYGLAGDYQSAARVSRAARETTLAFAFSGLGSFSYDGHDGAEVHG